MQNDLNLITQKEISSMLINLNRLRLNRKAHIKKYNKLRILHSEIIDNMEDYILNNKYNIEKFKNIIKDEFENANNIKLDIYNDDDSTILLELFVYKNHPKIPSITDIYLKNNKFRNKEKVKMLEAMKNSYVGLFEVIDVDVSDGYVTYRDVFTKKKFKIIDIAMSSTLQISKNKKVYLYNRVITYEDISFSTGIHCNFTSDSKELKKFIKSHNYKNNYNFTRCLMLYNIYRKSNSVIVNYNGKYENR